MKSTIVMTIVGLAVVSGQVFAEQERHPPHGINKYQRHEDQRIKQGVKSGQLTKEEVKQLKQERHEVRQEEKAYRSDGHLNKDERKDLHQDLNQMSKDIYKEKHDGEVRTPPAK